LLRLVSAAAVGVAAAFALAACGTGGLVSGPTDSENGRKLFQEKCAGCHGLAAAGSPGGVGPNLDDSFAQARADGFHESAIREIVHEQILYPGQFVEIPNNPNYIPANMPAKLVTGQDAEDVAAYVAENAGTQGFAESQVVTSNDGKEIFSKKCASCHVLKVASATGTIGPNLDLLKPPFARIRTQVINGGRLMPAFKDVLTARQIEAVARYVARNAGK
jgi:cbb3-type cytochrome c oxidase subunit III